MRETTEQIATDLDRTRGVLKSNFEELEAKVNAITDWRYQLRKRPGLAMVAAFVGGAILAAVVNGSRR